MRGDERFHIGCHLSSAKGFAAMGRQARELGADTFQCFLRNPRGREAKALDATDLAALGALLREEGFAPILGHAPYILNLCSGSEQTRALSRRILAADLERMAYFPPGQYYNLHPGSHVGQGVETGIEQIAAALNAIVRPEQKTVVLLETMAGKGSEIGGRFEELRAILDRADAGVSDKLGVCLDTCHIFDGGYDIVHDLDGVLTEFDRVIGLERLKAVHVNDSKNDLGSHKDRHACIGAGRIGEEALIRVARHEALRGLPFCLETPNDLAGYAREIRLFRDRLEDRAN